MFLTLPWKEMFVAGSLTFLSDHYLHLLFLNAEQQPIKVKLYKNVLFWYANEKANPIFFQGSVRNIYIILFIIKIARFCII